MCVLIAQEKEQAILDDLESQQVDNHNRRAVVQPLENILANMKFTSTTTLQPSQTTDKKLSSRANDVVTQLPDFSFMKARVLMFPLKGQAISTEDAQQAETSESIDVQRSEEIYEMF